MKNLREIASMVAMMSLVLVAVGALLHFFADPSPCGAGKTLKCTSTVQDVPISRGGVVYTTRALVQDCKCAGPGE
jgi:hypothetical protein